MDAIISVPETRIKTSNFGRDVELDLSTKEKEIENRMFPLNIILNTEEEFYGKEIIWIITDQIIKSFKKL